MTQKDIKYRRIVGLVLGALLGLVYGCVSQSINHFILPGVPLYQPPLGAVGNTTVWMLVGGLIGLMSAWPNESVIGAFLGGITGAVIIVLVTLFTGRMDEQVWVGKIAGVLFLSIPLAGALTPISGIHRWAVNKIVDARLGSYSFGVALRWPIILLLLVGAVGATALLPAYGRIMIIHTNNVLTSAFQASDISELAPPLQGRLVGDFLEKAVNNYRLEWTNKNINRFAIPRPLADRPWEESAVITHFENGWYLVCVYVQSDAEPSCKGFDELPPLSQ